MDFNGVIINDEPIQMRAYQDVLKDEGVDLTEEDYYNSLGMDDRTFVSSAFERAGKSVNEEAIGRITAAKTARWRETVADDPPVFDGIVDFVEKMAREFTLGLVSMAGRDEIDLILEKTGLARHFSTIVSAGDVTRCKPDAECFRTGFERLDAVRTAMGHFPITHRECVVIEDSPPGIAAARLADLQALGVANTVSASELRAAGARAVATDLRDWMPETIRLVFT